MSRQTVFVILGKGFGDNEEAHEIIAVCKDEKTRNEKIRELSDQYAEMVAEDADFFKFQEWVVD